MIHFRALRAGTYILLLATALLALPFTGPAAIAQTVYAAVLGNPKYIVGSSTLHSGLFRSSDHGRTWEHLGPQNLKAFAVDAVDSSRGTILYIAAGNGIHKSTDAGGTWRIITDWRIGEVMDVKIDQKAPDNVYAATAFGFWRSSDGGKSWENPEGMLKNRYIYRISRIEQSGELTVAGEDAIYVSYDNGSSWSYQLETRSPRGLFTIGSHGRALASTKGPVWYPNTESGSGKERPGSIYPEMIIFDITHRNDTIFAVGSEGALFYPIATRSNSWRSMTHNLRIPIILHAVAVTPQSILTGTFGQGIFRLEGETWVPSGLEGAQVWSMMAKEW